jgi:peroxiredoxin
MMKTWLLAAVTIVGLSARAHAEATVGKPAPEFKVTDQDGKTHSLSQYKGKIVVLEWTNPGCPFVQRHYKAETMEKLSTKLAKDNVVWLAVNSTASNTTADTKKWMKDEGFAYPTLQDNDGAIGHAYGCQDHAAHVRDRQGRRAPLRGRHRQRSAREGSGADEPGRSGGIGAPRRQGPARGEQPAVRLLGEV